MQYFSPDASWGVSGQQSDYIEKIGQPVGSMYGLVTDGFNTTNDFSGYDAVTQSFTMKPGVVKISSGLIAANKVQPGTIKFRDLNNDGMVDLVSDRTVIGNPTPQFTGGLNQQFSYRNFDASIFVYKIYWIRPRSKCKKKPTNSSTRLFCLS